MAAPGTQFNEEVEAPELTLIMDELEAGEAAVELDDKEPQKKFLHGPIRNVLARELAIYCSFQADGCDMIDLGAQDRSSHPRVSRSTPGRMLHRDL